MGYVVEMIEPSERDELFRTFEGCAAFERNADIHGVCVRLLTDSQRFEEMWIDNFKPMSDFVRPHCTLAVRAGEGDFKVKYEPFSKTAFLLDCDYYGYVKSVALAQAGDFLEESALCSRGSVHGSVVDVNGAGVAIVAPSGVGKTTHSYGLLLKNGTSLVADDWFFVEVAASVVAHSSEKRSYVRDDVGENWEEFSRLVEEAELDGNQRAVVDVERVIGRGRTRDQTVLQRLILLKRDKTDRLLARSLSTHDALQYLVDNDFCNPHQLVRSIRKNELRVNFFENLLSRVECWMVNTTAPPRQTQDLIRQIAAGEMEAREKELA